MTVTHGTKLVSIQALRAIAAWAVVFHHTAQLYYGVRPHESSFNSFFAHFGQLGVDVFFIISGFVMYGSMRHAASVKEFLLHRAARIVPNYWTYTVVIALILIYIPNSFSLSRFEPLFFIKSLAFIPQQNPAGIGYFPILTVGWTLNLEVVFYGLCCLACLSVPAARTYLAFSLLCAVFFSCTLLVTAWSGVFYATPMLFLFAIGLACGVAYGAHPLPDGWSSYMLCVVFLGLSLSCFALGNRDHGSLHVTMGSLFLFLSFTCVENTSLMTTRVARGFSWLGDSSYSTYLCHVPVIVLVAHAFPGLANGRYAVLVTPIVVSVLIVSRLSYVFVERRLGRALLSWANART